MWASCGYPAWRVLLSDSEQVGPRECLVSQPLARVLVRVGVVRRLVHHLHFHFTDSKPRCRMVGDIEVTSKGTELLELDLINYSAFSVGHGEL